MYDAIFTFFLVLLTTGTSTAFFNTTFQVSCGETNLTGIGTIRSPSYPGFYPANTTCTWDITARRHEFIKINFTHFDIQGNSNDTIVKCDKDSLKIYTKIGEDKFRLDGTYCGSVVPATILYQTNALRLVFKSDSSVQKTGFALDYVSALNMCTIDNCIEGCVTSIENITCQCPKEFVLQQNGRDCKRQVSPCTYVINTGTGVITSPNYPEDYNNNAHCFWFFKTSPGHKIKITFAHFYLESHPSCGYDNVILYDGLSNMNKSLGVYCGSVNPPDITSSTNELSMTFKSDVSIVAKGFFATYSGVCGGSLNAFTEEQYLTSHAEFGYGNYSNNATCEWVINATSGYVISVDFLSFHLQNCDGNDYVEILDGPNENSTSLARYCGSTLTPAIMAVTSTDNAITVRFGSDDTITHKGFALSYTAVEKDENNAPHQ